MQNGVGAARASEAAKQIGSPKANPEAVERIGMRCSHSILHIKSIRTEPAEQHHCIVLAM